MTPVALLNELASAGVGLYLNERNELRARALPGAMTASIRATITAHRDELIATLADPVAVTVPNVSALSSEEQQAWQREIVAAMRYARVGGTGSPVHHLDHDLKALQQFVPPGICLDCGGLAPRDGHHWCAACEAKGRKR
jgi:hypothetical protein